MQHKIIPFQAVKDALWLAKVRLAKSGRGQGDAPIGRFAAYTNNPLLNISCQQAMRGHPPYPRLVNHFGPMSRGYLAAVLTCVRAQHGLAEVRRTWGAGLRELRAEFSDGVLR